MAAPLLSRLPLVLLVLLAASETALCGTNCPAYCAKQTVVLTEHGISTVQGPQAKLVINVVVKLQHTSAHVPLAKVLVGNVWVNVPKQLVIQIKKLAKSEPKFLNILVKILWNKFGKPIQPPRTHRTTKEPTTHRPRKGEPEYSGDKRQSIIRMTKITTRKPTPPVQPPKRKHTTKKPTTSRHTTPSGRTTYHKTRKTTRKQTTRAHTTKRKPTTTRPRTRRPTTRRPPPLPQIMAPAQPKINYPSIDSVDVTIRGQTGLNTTVQSILEVVTKFPNFLLSYSALLERLGVKMPELAAKGKVTYVIVNRKKIKLPRPLVVSYTVRINGKMFRLPEQLNGLVKYLSTNQAQLINVVSMIRQLQGTFSTNKQGYVVEMSVLGSKYTFPRPISASVSVNGRNFVLPRDIKVLLASIKRNPAEFFKIQFLLEAFGVHFKASPGAKSIEARIGKNKYQIPTVKQVKVTINNREYSIPGDLQTIFSGSRIVSVGQLIAALQRAHVTVKVNRNTGGITGIVMDGVQIPFPVAAYLRINIYGRTYTLPYDLPKLISVLEEKHMPSAILSLLYTYYGVVPVRNRNNVVIALSFNGKHYKVKPQPQTNIVIQKYKLVLPRDSEKMNQLVLSGKIGVVQFMQALQMAGYTFIPEPDGALRRIHKGTEIINLSIEIRLSVKLGNILYRVPNDLPRLMQVIRGYNAKVIDKVMSELGKLGVRYTRRGKHLLVFFNGAKYEVQLKNVDRATTLIMILNNKRFVIPAQLNQLVAYATSLGSFAINTLISAFKHNGIKVSLTHGRITSIIMDGKQYKVGRAAVDLGNVRVKIRGRMYLIPRDLAKVKMLKNFKIYELISALMKAGAKPVFDAQSFVVAILYRGQRINFDRRFRVMIKVDQTGKLYHIPGQLAQIAKMLSRGKWDYKDVRGKLIEAGIKVPGGIVQKPIKTFSYMGISYEVKK